MASGALRVAVIPDVKQRGRPEARQLPPVGAPKGPRAGLAAKPRRRYSGPLRPGFKDKGKAVVTSSQRPIEVSPPGLRVLPPTPIDDGPFELDGLPVYRGEGDDSSRLVTVQDLRGLAQYKDPADTVPAAGGAGKRRLRLRRRGRQTAVFASSWQNLPGWWSDLTGKDSLSAARSWLRCYWDGVVDKISDGKEIMVNLGSEVGVRPLQLYQALFTNGDVRRPLWVCPELMAHLVSVRMFRPVSEGLLASLRSRARMWAKEEGVTVMDLVQFLPGTLVAASLPAADEVAAVGALRGRSAQWSAAVLGPLAQGMAKPSPGRPLGDYLRRPLAWFFKRTEGTMLGGGYHLTVNMPA